MSDLDITALAAEEVVNGLKKIYKKCVLPLEQAYKFDLFFSMPMQDVDFEAKPMILMLGQYSTGKTSFIRHLIGRDFPGMRIGPEPTTDKFTAVYYGHEDMTIPGQTLAVSQDLPFKTLGKFGSNFLNKFEGSCCSSNALKSFMFIDSPGVLSGAKQNKGRQYDFEAAVGWFADRADRILLLFDCNKLDINDEFKSVISTLRVHDEKIRVVLNKSDSIPEKELIRVYGALMWSLGKVFRTPEVLRVYISSFWDKPLDKNNYCYPLFKGDGAELIGELKSLPRQSAMQKINELLKRARLVKIHCQIISELKGELPTFSLFGGKKLKQKQMLEELPNEFRKIARKLGIPPTDFPNLTKFKDVLAAEDLTKYPTFNQTRVNKLEEALEKRIPELVKKLNERNLEAHKSFDPETANFNPFEDDDSSPSHEKKASEKQTQPVAAASKAPVQKSIQRVKSQDAKSVLSTSSAKSRKARLIHSNINQFRNSTAAIGRRLVKEPTPPVTHVENHMEEVETAPVVVQTQSQVKERNSYDEAIDSLSQLEMERGDSTGEAGSDVSSPRPPPLTEIREHYEDASRLQRAKDEANDHMARLQHMNNMNSNRSPTEHPLAPFEPTPSGTNNVWRRSRVTRESNVSNEWIVTMVDKTESDNIFYQQRLINGKLTGKAAAKAFSHLGLDPKIMNKIWKLANMDGNNELDADQYALAVVLAKRYKKGEPIPENLTWNMIPPSHREL